MDSSGAVQRVLRKTVLGTVQELPTRKLTQRRLDLLLAHINSIGYRPGKSASFAEFVELWRERILKMQKPSFVRATHSHLGCHLVSRFSPTLRVQSTWALSLSLGP